MVYSDQNVTKIPLCFEDGAVRYGMESIFVKKSFDLPKQSGPTAFPVYQVVLSCCVEVARSIMGTSLFL